MLKIVTCSSKSSLLFGQEETVRYLVQYCSSSSELYMPPMRLIEPNQRPNAVIYNNTKANLPCRQGKLYSLEKFQNFTKMLQKLVCLQ